MSEAKVNQPGLDPRETVEILMDSQDPFLIGVRHHSPACAAAVPVLLDAYKPQCVFVELPAEFEGWLKWLGHPALMAPVALSGVMDSGDDLAFYPFADFSPELCAVRWAVKNGIPVKAFDRPLTMRESRSPRPSNMGGEEGENERKDLPSALERLLNKEQTQDTADLWDRLVEANALGATAHQVRQAGLTVGWTLRFDAYRSTGILEKDILREAYMRQCLADYNGRAAVVVGAFHAPALLPEPLLWTASKCGVEGDDKQSEKQIVTSLIPYSHDLLDSRSGYPAGIRDPLWQHQIWQLLCNPDKGCLETIVSELLVQVCKLMRLDGHVASVPDAKEAVRMAFDLARIRNLPGPSRREVLEAIESSLGQGELLGRGRILAAALEQVMVGNRRGHLAPSTPSSGLLPHVTELLKQLKLPGPEQEPRPKQASNQTQELRLDPIRSPLDKLRHVTLKRLSVCGIPYGTPVAGVAAGGVETLTCRWTVEWTPATAAMIELAAVRGVTLEQAACGALSREQHRLVSTEKWTPKAQVDALALAAECGLVQLVYAHLNNMMRGFLSEAGLAEIIEAVTVFRRIKDGHVPGLVNEGSDKKSTPQKTLGALTPFIWPTGVSVEPLFQSAIASVDGIFGSEKSEDANALQALVMLLDKAALVGGRIVWTLNRMAQTASEFMQGAACALLVQLGKYDSDDFGRKMGSWVDAAVGTGGNSAERQRVLSFKLSGALVVAEPLFEADPAFCTELMDRVEQLSDETFFSCVAALRRGFNVLSPAARERLLVVIGERLALLDPQKKGLDVSLDYSGEIMMGFARADVVGQAALKQLFLSPTVSARGIEKSVFDPEEKAALQDSGNEISIGLNKKHTVTSVNRWRLILGRAKDKLTGRQARAARALDELYGMGTGEGSLSVGGGMEDGFPSAREWGEELEALFGKGVCEQVLGMAAAKGHSGALLALDTQTVTPSIELLEQVLSLKGGLAETHVHRLRQLVARIVNALVNELAVRVRPALSGTRLQRPTRRSGGPLNLPKTILANLKNTRIGPDNRPQVLPEQLIFDSRGKRQMDWHIVLAVDVSGSMEPSVIYSAMMGAILSQVPWVSVSFLAFSTEVIDLSDNVSDPLGLLLEVSVGGGTHIAKALRYARQKIRVPSQTIVLLVTDFEEGFGVEGLLAEVRALVETGAKGLGLASLDDKGKPRYHQAVAQLVAGAGMPVAALTPLELARWVGEQIK